MTLAVVGDPDPGPGGGKKEEEYAECWGLSLMLPLELIDSIWGVKQEAEDELEADEGGWGILSLWRGLGCVLALGLNPLKACTLSSV